MNQKLQSLNGVMFTNSQPISQTIEPSLLRLSMKTNVDVLVEVPCFKCLFWEWKKDSHLYCNPNECQKLTDWLLKDVESYQQDEHELVVLAAQQSKVVEKPKP
ncbi:hypothetical protein HXY33_09165 [Candidatus Bathyarchaeota archaeon]|nr:hypothetical protein [Candidatus Bathyarchaeota archaeon]